MPPKQSSTGAGRGRPAKANKAQPPARDASESSNPFESSDDQAPEANQAINIEEEHAEPEKSIPKALLTRLLHEFFVKEATRISRDANTAVSKYVDIFVREAIVRTAVEKPGGFLEVEDLEKVTPQLLLDL
ncbi:CENP-S associating centromere protein X domain-containing protein [Trichoderma sp. SZMC 28013]